MTATSPTQPQQERPTQERPDPVPEAAGGVAAGGVAVDGGTERGADGLVRALRPTAALDRAAPGDRTKWFRLVTRDRDGHGTRFDPMGGDLSDHRANPVWLWGHGSGRNKLDDPPDPRHVIGRVLEWDQRPDALDILVEFDVDEPFAEMVWQKVRRGLIRACSLGAVPLEPPEQTTEEGPDGQTVVVPVFRRWLLKEASCVILGSNPRAVVVDRAESEVLLRALGDAPAVPVDAVPVVEAPAGAELVGAALAAAAGPASPGWPSPWTTARGAGPVAAMGRSERPKLRREVASVVVRDGAGAVLFGRRRDDGKWTLPGGHLEPGEREVDGARRELREEAGLDFPVDRFRPLGSGRVGEYRIHVFRVERGDAYRPADGRVAEPDAAGDPDAELVEFAWAGPPGAGGRTAEVLGALRAPRNVALHLLGWSGADGIEDVQRPGEAHGAAGDGAGGADGADGAGDVVAGGVDRTGGVGRADAFVVRIDGAGDLARAAREAAAAVGELEGALLRVAGVDFALAPGVRESLRQGLRWHTEGLGGPGLVQSTIEDARKLVGNGAWWPAKARAAHGWFARHGALDHPRSQRVRRPRDPLAPGGVPGVSGGGAIDGTGAPGGAGDEEVDLPTPYGVAWALWGGDAGRDQVAGLVARMEAAAAGAGPAGGLIRGLRAVPYLPDSEQDPVDRDVASAGPTPPGVLTSAVAGATAGERKTMPLPKLSPAHRAAHQKMIGHQMDAAEQHGKIAEELPGEHAEMRTMHRGLAMRSLESACDMHRAMCRDDMEQSMPADGVERGVPPFLKDEELKRAFASTCALVGRLPRTAAMACRDQLGSDDGEELVAKLAALKDDRTDLRQLRDVQRREAGAALAARRDELIAHYGAPERAIITPAQALTMRGHDPATYKPGDAPTGQPWSPTRIEQYVAERVGGGPVADVVRTAPLAPAAAPAAPVPGATPLQPPTPQAPAAPGAPWQSSLVRMGGSPGPAVDIASASAEMASALRVGDMPGQVRAGQPDGVRIAEVAAQIARGEIRFGRPSMDAVAPLASAGATGMRPVE